MSPLQPALGPREHIPLSWEPPRTVAAGLKNTGNACYMNATLQCLTHTGPLASHMLALRTSQMACQKTTCMMCVMQAHLERAFQHSGAIIQPSCALGAGFHVHKQEDAHEFLMFILESMEKSRQSCGMGLDLAGREPGLIREIFGGSWRSQIRCFQCQSTSDTFDPYLDITLDIAGAQSVEQALARLVEPEELAGEDAYHCGVCLHKVSASKTLTLHSASKVLILVLKRFSPLTGDKVDGLVRFPQRLDMQPYMSQPREGPLVYDLYAVLVHAGWSSHSGHYFSYIKAGNGQWYKMDDAKVSTCAVSSVLSQRAYVLFYSQEGSNEKGNGESLWPGGDPTAPDTRGKQRSTHHLHLKKDTPRELVESPAHVESTALKEISLDQWKVFRDQHRPKTQLNLRKIEFTQDPNLVLIHPSKHRDHGRENHSEKEDSLPPKHCQSITGQLSGNAGRLPREDSRARSKKGRNKRGKACVLVLS